MNSTNDDIRVLFDAENKMERSKHDEAYELIKSIDISTTTNWPPSKQGIFFWILGRWEDLQNHLQDAVSHYSKSIQFLQKSSNTTALIRTMISHSKMLARTEDNEKSLYLLKEAYKIAVYNNIPTFPRISLLFQLGVQHGKLGEIHSAIYFLDQALTYSNELDLQYKAGHIHMSLGICHMQLNQFVESKNHLEDAVLSFQLTKDTENLAGTYMNLGILFGHHQIFDQATNYLLKAIDLYQQLEMSQLRLSCMIKLATFFYNDGEWEQASTFCKTIILEKHENHLIQIESYELLSDMERKKNQLNDAIKLINNALQIAEKFKLYSKRLISKKAQLLQQKGEWEQALEWYTRL